MNRHAEWDRYLRHAARVERVSVGRARRLVRALRRVIRSGEDTDQVFACLELILRHEQHRTKNDLVAAFCRMRRLDFMTYWKRVRSTPVDGAKSF